MNWQRFLLLRLLLGHAAKKLGLYIFWNCSYMLLVIKTIQNKFAENKKNVHAQKLKYKPEKAPTRSAGRWIFYSYDDFCVTQRKKLGLYIFCNFSNTLLVIKTIYLLNIKNVQAQKLKYKPENDSTRLAGRWIF